MQHFKSFCSFILFFSLLSILQTGFAEQAQTPVTPASNAASKPASTAQPKNSTAQAQPTKAAANTVPTPVGRVVWIKGILKAMMPNKEQRILQKSSIIYLHDTLITDDKSEAEVVYTDNTLLTFRPQTQFYINKYQYSAGTKKGSAGKYVMNLIEGGFRTVTGLIAKKNPSDYEVDTPVATIGVRGTDYVVYVHNGVLDIGYYKGSPCVNSNTKNGKKTLCLDKNTPYATVPAPGAVPVALQEQPAVLKQFLQIVPAVIGPFSGGPGNGNISGNSFCIE